MPPRHIVTGTDRDGKSCVLTDGPVPNLLAIGEASPDFEFSRVWSTDGTGAAVASGANGVAFTDIFPPTGGIRFHQIIYPSGFGTASADSDASSTDRLAMHRSDSIDFGVVLEGELTLVLEDGSETILRAGDLLVQDATVHGWRNTSAARAIAVFVMLGTPPLPETTRS